MFNFNQMDETEATREYYDREVTKFIDELFSDNTLEVVEHYASENNLISSEGMLSDQFDEQVAPHVITAYGPDDEPAMNEAFCNWSDGLCKDGQLHDIQYNQYCYVGKYS